MNGEAPTTVALVQPTRRREWELRRGDEILAELQLPSLKREGRARVGGRELVVRTTGIFRREHALVDAVTGEELARVRGRSVEIRGLEKATWKSLGRGRGYGFRGPDGEPWLRAKASSGILRTTGQIEVGAGHEPAVPALLAAYLLIRQADDAAAAASATTVAAT